MSAIGQRSVSASAPGLNLGLILGLLIGLLPPAGALAQEEEAPAPATAAEEPAAEEPGSEELAISIRKGLEYLLETQNEDGSWGGWKNATFTSGFANPATYKMWQIGTTALATRTALELGPGEEHAEAADRGLDFLVANQEPRRPADWDVDNNWALVYGTDALARALQHPRYKGSEREKELREAGQAYVDGLQKYQSPRGGWGYYSDPDARWQPEWATSFTSAAAVLSLYEARQAGLDVPEKVWRAGVRAVERSRLPNGAYDYEVSAIPRHLRMESINQVKGSLGRIQVCNLALLRAGSELVDEEDLVWGLEQFVQHHKFLDVARNKPIPHEAYYANAAYFYLFAHYYAAQVLRELPAEKRERFASFVQAGILKTQQADGSMWDFWIANNTKGYGTSFGIMGLEHTLAQEP